jgi:hypothetical protein
MNDWKDLAIQVAEVWHHAGRGLPAPARARHYLVSSVLKNVAKAYAAGKIPSAVTPENRARFKVLVQEVTKAKLQLGTGLRARGEVDPRRFRVMTERFLAAGPHGPQPGPYIGPFKKPKPKKRLLKRQDPSLEQSGAGA